MSVQCLNWLDLVPLWLFVKTAYEREVHFLQVFLQLIFQWSNCQYSTISLDNGLVPNRRKAIIWANGMEKMNQVFVIVVLWKMKNTFNAISQNLNVAADNLVTEETRASVALVMS